jgi:hypothetical protein
MESTIISAKFRRLMKGMDSSYRFITLMSVRLTSSEN